MAPSKARPGFGCIFKIGSGTSTETFAALAEVVNVPGFGVTHRTDEVTHMGSDGGWAEHIGLGIKEGKAFTLDMNFVADDTQHISLFDTRVEAGSRHNYQILFTDVGATTVTFSAIVQDVEISHERDSAADMSVTFLPTGGFVWA